MFSFRSQSTSKKGILKNIFDYSTLMSILISAEILRAYFLEVFTNAE